MKSKSSLVILVLLVVAVIIYYFVVHHGGEIVLTGIVTTDEIIVSSEIQGRLQHLYVREGDEVTNGQVLAVIQPAEHLADVSYYRQSAAQSAANVDQMRAELAWQQSQTSNLVWQSEAQLAATQQQIAQAQADLENFSLDFKREESLYKQGVDSVKEYDTARTTYNGAKARVQSLQKQAVAAEAAVAMAKATEQQVASREAALDAGVHQNEAVGAQREKAEIVLGYTKILAPTNATVDVRAALQGEVINPGQGILTLINQSNLWVRADVEETYIDRIKLGDKFTVRLPSGATREGTVFYRGVDADYATQRDVSRSKRDIKTFEIRLRCNNDDRALAVGMTAFVLLNVSKP